MMRPALTKSLSFSARTGLWLAVWVLATTFMPRLQAGGLDESELLPPEQAFALTARAEAIDMIRLTWTIADGYYMYKHQFKFEPETPGVRFGEPVFPQGKVKTDEFFGEVETYRHEVSIIVPVILDPGAKIDTVRVKTRSQGCADAGICYVPLTQRAAVTLPVADDTADRPATGGGFFDTLTALGRKIGIGRSGDEPFLPADQAFVLSIDAENSQRLIARWDIADGYYLYRSKFGFDVKSPADITVAGHQAPPGKPKYDEYFGDMEVYYDEVAVIVDLQHSRTDTTEIELEVKYQGCADAGFCYPPITQVIPVKLPAGNGAAAASTAAAPADPALPVSEQDHYARLLANDRLLIALAAFYGVGILLAFTPCVFPMVPILSSMIAGQGQHTSTRRAFTLSLSYVLAMALTYTAAGIIAGSTGANLQIFFQQPWIIVTFSAVFVALALSMFGFYELQLPASLQTRFAELSRQKGRQGTVAGAAVMGFFSALIVGPCLAAPLAGALIYISQSGDAVLGGLALFALAMGMGTPLLLIGTSAGKLLPKAGPWMDAVKAVFGVLLLGLAIWMLERILPAMVTMLLWSILLIVSAIYMGALTRLEPTVSGWRKLWQGLGVVLLVYGAVLLVGAAGGGRDPLLPLAAFPHNTADRTTPGDGTVTAGTTTAPVASPVSFKRIKGLDGLMREVERSTAQGKPVMVDFYADWCIECKRMERDTFANPAVQRVLSKVTLLQADVTANDDIDKALLRKYGLFGPPTILFFTADGKEIAQARVIGYMDAETFLEHTRRTLGL